MKQLFYLSLVVLASCGGKTQVEKDAEAVCDCLQNSAGKPVEERVKCTDLHRTHGEKYLGNADEVTTYNKIVTPCIIESVKTNHE